MHPELLENPQFLKYYQKWQNDPKSVVFIPVAEYLLKYRLVKDALVVCKQGMEYHPQMIIGKLLLAKIYINLKKLDDARNVLNDILMSAPNQPVALDLINEIEKRSTEANEVYATSSLESPWCTLTMGDIYANQGNIEEAEKIYKTILKRDPNNNTVKERLDSLGVDE